MTAGELPRRLAQRLDLASVLGPRTARKHAADFRI
jgi:hypothetical protein